MNINDIQIKVGNIEPISGQMPYFVFLEARELGKVESASTHDHCCRIIYQFFYFLLKIFNQLQRSNLNIN